jgi:transcriptional regulator with XRE-family HTH domain
MDIGNKLKELRVLKGLTQEELADRSELSKGFISQLERNLTSPSITTLMDILQCLGTSIGEFFNEAPDEQIVFGKQDYFVKEDTEYKNEIKWIIPNAQKNTIEPIYLTLQALPVRTHLMKEKNLATSFRELCLSIWEIRLIKPKKGNPFIIQLTKPISCPVKTGQP